MKKAIYKTKEEMPLFLTVMDVANLLGISRASAYELVRQENFPKLKVVQGRTIIPRQILNKWRNSKIHYHASFIIYSNLYLRKAYLLHRYLAVF